jgi:hypothetical protein
VRSTFSSDLRGIVLRCLDKENAAAGRFSRFVAELGDGSKDPPLQRSRLALIIAATGARANDAKVQKMGRTLGGSRDRKKTGIVRARSGRQWLAVRVGAGISLRAGKMDNPGHSMVAFRRGSDSSHIGQDAEHFHGKVLEGLWRLSGSGV